MKNVKWKGVKKRFGNRDAPRLKKGELAGRRCAADSVNYDNVVQIINLRMHCVWRGACVFVCVCVCLWRGMCVGSCVELFCKFLHKMFVFVVYKNYTVKEIK